MTYLHLLLLKRLQDSVDGRIGQETQIPAAGLHVLGLGLEFAAGLVEVDLLGTEDEGVPSLARSGPVRVCVSSVIETLHMRLKTWKFGKVGWSFSTWQHGKGGWKERKYTMSQSTNACTQGFSSGMDWMGWKGNSIGELSYRSTPPSFGDVKTSCFMPNSVS